MKKIVLGVTIGAFSSALIAGMSSAPAFADSATPAPTPSASSTSHARTLAEIQASAATQTTNRITKLNAAIATVNSDSSMSSTDKSTALATLNGDLSGMKSVAAKIASDTSASQARTDYATIFTDYRVYAVALPQTRIAATADHATGVEIPRLVKEQARLSALLSGKDQSKSTPALEADLTDATSQLQKATSALDGVASSALAVTPSEYNSNHDVLKSIRSTVATARAALKQSRTDLKDVVVALQAK